MEIFAIKSVSTGIILCFFAGIIYLLRYLYGPKGRLRDPKWDAWNEQARQELLEQQMLQKDGALIAPFLRYAKGFFTGDEAVDKHLQLKIEHTFYVYEHAKEIARKEKAFENPQVSRALLLAALYHDVGRFAQFSQYRTFSDAHSCNHGTLGAKVIRQQGFLREEPREVQQWVLAAVAAHNRVKVPHAILGATQEATLGTTQGNGQDAGQGTTQGALRAVLCAVRDADKLDILRVMKNNLAPEGKQDPVVLLHLEDAPDKYTPAILEAVNAGQTALYRDMRYVNDFRILACSWLYDLHFATSLEIVKKAKYLPRIIAGLSALPNVQHTLLAVVEKKLQ